MMLTCFTFITRGQVNSAVSKVECQRKGPTIGQEAHTSKILSLEDSCCHQDALVDTFRRGYTGCQVPAGLSAGNPD